MKKFELDFTTEAKIRVNITLDNFLLLRIRGELKEEVWRAERAILFYVVGTRPAICQPPLSENLHPFSYTSPLIIESEVDRDGDEVLVPFTSSPMMKLTNLRGSSVTFDGGSDAKLRT